MPFSGSRARRVYSAAAIEEASEVRGVLWSAPDRGGRAKRVTAAAKQSRRACPALAVTRDARRLHTVFRYDSRNFQEAMLAHVLSYYGRKSMPRVLERHITTAALYGARC